MKLWKLIPNRVMNWRNKRQLSKTANAHRICRNCPSCKGNLGRTVLFDVALCPQCGHAACNKREVVI